jgi:hypothetical protein
MFGPKINELIGGWINLHDEEFHNLYLWNVIRMVKSSRIWSTGQVVSIGNRRNGCRVLVRKTKARRPLGTRRRRWEDHIKWILQKQDDLL